MQHAGAARGLRRPVATDQRTRVGERACRSEYC